MRRLLDDGPVATSVTLTMGGMLVWGESLAKAALSNLLVLAIVGLVRYAWDRCMARRKQLP